MADGGRRNESEDELRRRARELFRDGLTVARGNDPRDAVNFSKSRSRCTDRSPGPNVSAPFACSTSVRYRFASDTIGRPRSAMTSRPICSTAFPAVNGMRRIVCSAAVALGSD